MAWPQNVVTPPPAPSATAPPATAPVQPVTPPSPTPVGELQPVGLTPLTWGSGLDIDRYYTKVRLLKRGSPPTVNDPVVWVVCVGEHFRDAAVIGTVIFWLHASVMIALKKTEAGHESRVSRERWARLP